MKMSVRSGTGFPGPAAAAAVGSLAGGWLVLRVFVGLDFTDEMQYYGEISSVVRSGRFFQVDLFIQQLGYFLTLPFFRLHALLFPDLSYLVLFGRLLLLAAYAATGLLFWRSASRRGLGLVSRIAGIATLAAWIPFQIFAPSYNSLAYLLTAAFFSIWTDPDCRKRRTWPAIPAALLVALGISYPPAGLTLTALAAVGETRRAGPRAARQLLAWTAIGAAGVSAAMFRLQGPELPQDLAAAIRFSRTFGVGSQFLHWTAVGAWLAIIATSAILLRLPQRRDRAKAKPTQGAAHAGRASAMLVVAIFLLPACASPTWGTGPFASLAFLASLALAAAIAPAAAAANKRDLVELTAAGLVLGTVFAVTSGNGMLNFGVGAAALSPFLVQHALQRAGDPGAGRVRSAAVRTGGLVIPCLLMLNGCLHPYREQRGWAGLEPVRGVPAFRGIWTSATKIEAIELVRQIPEAGTLCGRRLLVAGPHAWMYFALQAEPATPMFFMHFTGSDAANEILAARMGTGPPPEAILLGAELIPPSIGTRIDQLSQHGYVLRRHLVPIDLARRYLKLTGYDLPREILWLDGSGNAATPQ